MNNNENKTSSESQNAKIRSWLEDGKRISPLLALHLFGCFRLASRIWDLRERGMNIGNDWVIESDGKRHKEYYWIDYEQK